MKKVLPADDRENTLLTLSAAMANLQHSYRATVDVMVLKNGISLPLAWPLMMIGWHGNNMPQAHLAEVLNSKPVALARLLRQLVNAGLVEYRKDKTGQMNVVSLTKTGALKSARIGAEMRKIRRALFEDIPSGDVDKCLSVLTLLNDRMAIGATKAIPTSL